MSTDRTLASLTDTARRSTGAVVAALVGRGADDRLTIIATAGPLDGAVPASIDPDDTYAGMVLTSEQPMALQIRPGDPRVVAETALLGREPTAVCCVPCGGEDDMAGVLVLVDKAGGGAFDFDDVEVASMLAEVTGVALEEQGTTTAAPDPDALAATLRDLAQRDPARYRRVASLIETVLASA